MHMDHEYEWNFFIFCVVSGHCLVPKHKADCTLLIRSWDILKAFKGTSIRKNSVPYQSPKSMKKWCHSYQNHTYSLILAICRECSFYLCWSPKGHGWQRPPKNNFKQNPQSLCSMKPPYDKIQYDDTIILLTIPLHWSCYHLIQSLWRAVT